MVERHTQRSLLADQPAGGEGPNSAENLEAQVILSIQEAVEDTLAAVRGHGQLIGHVRPVEPGAEGGGPGSAISRKADQNREALGADVSPFRWRGLELQQGRLQQPAREPQHGPQHQQEEQGCAASDPTPSGGAPGGRIRLGKWVQGSSPELPGGEKPSGNPSAGRGF